MPETPAAIDARIAKRLPAGRLSAGFNLDIHLQLPSGVTALFGPSGAGKSLTLNSIAGFATPDGGRILVNNELFFDGASGFCLPPERRRCGYVFQDHALFPHMTVRDNLRFAAATARTGNRALARRRKIKELLEIFELQNLALRKPAQLSGGQRQRAALARILASEPRLLLLDEPTRGLDSRLRNSFYEILETTRQRLQAPMVLVTHDLEECFQLAETVCLMEDGRLLQSGSRESVFERPVSVQAARVLGLHNMVPARIEYLDPGRNVSRLRVFESEIEGLYFPGHLIGDAGFACFRRTECSVKAPQNRGENNSLVLRVYKTDPMPNGVRIQFEGDISATVTEEQFRNLKECREMSLHIRPGAIQFLAN